VGAECVGGFGLLLVSVSRTTLRALWRGRAPGRGAGGHGCCERER